MQRAVEKAREYILTKSLTKPGDGILAALSGGTDSVALLLILNELKSELGISLFAAHFNHGIRKNADEDEKFCAELCLRLGIPFAQERGNVPAFARKNSLSLETAARLLRYDFLYRASKSFGADAVATAHHAEDDAESILMHVLRGSGLSGLAGIREAGEATVQIFNEDKEKIGTKRMRLIRPLISFSKSELLAFLEEAGQAFRTDETNYEDGASRNFLRLKVFPALRERINPAVERNICRLGELAREDDEYLFSLANAALEQARSGEGFDASLLFSLAPPIKKRCLQLALAEKGATADIERVHIEALSRLLENSSGASLDLPRCRARIAFSRLIIEKTDGKEREKEEGEFTLPLAEGEYETPLGRFNIALEAAPDMEKSGDMEYNGVEAAARRFPGGNIALMDADALEESLTVRTRRSGDRFHPLNGEFRMKLKDFFIGRRVDARRRDLIPLVLSGGEIVFVAGFTVADRVKVKKSTRRVARLEFIPKGE